MDRIGKEIVFTESKIKRNVEKTRKQYKSGKDFKGTCIIFINGKWDPWASKSITDQSQTSDKNHVILYEKGEHEDDMFDPPINNVPMAKEIIKGVQKQVKKKIGEFLNSNDCAFYPTSGYTS